MTLCNGRGHIGLRLIVRLASLNVESLRRLNYSGELNKSLNTIKIQVIRTESCSESFFYRKVQK